MDGVFYPGSAYPNGDQRLDTFCANFTSNVTLTCYGESSGPTNSVSENDSAQVMFINEG